MSHKWNCKNKLTEWTTVPLQQQQLQQQQQQQQLLHQQQGEEETSSIADTISRSNIAQKAQEIQVSNPNVVLPEGLSVVPNFLSEEEASALLEELDKERQQRWTWQGFAHRRRVQKYNATGDNLPERLQQLLTRFQNHQQQKPETRVLHHQRQPIITHVVMVEEFPFQAATRSTTNAVVTTFASPLPPTTTNSNNNDDDEEEKDDYFVGQVAIGLTKNCAAVQHMNRPKKRVADCWQLHTKDHWTDIHMVPRTLVVKTGEALWDWRSCVTRSTECHEDDRVVVVKFYHLPNDDRYNDSMTSGTSSTSRNNNNINHRQEATTTKTTVMPPLHEILTILVTTSPIKSNPSTELLERTFDTFAFGGHDFSACRKVVVCDGVRVQEGTGAVTKKHANVRQALRNGVATSAQAEHYEEFKRRLRTLCDCQDGDNSPFANTIVQELSTREGYGFALRHALHNYVTTPYVCVIQHDRTFMRPTPMRQAVQTMWHHPDTVKYIGMSMRSNLIYRDIFMSKYGKPAHEELGPLVLRPPELMVDATAYGPDSLSVQTMTIPTKKMQTNLDSVKQTYMVSAHNVGQNEWLANNPTPAGQHQMTLTPTLFWYDNTHIVETAHYRDFIFNPTYNMVARGGFVEEKTSPVLIKAVERLGLAAGHEKFGCYLLDDHSGFFFTGHLDGGTYIPKAEKERKFGISNKT